MKKHLVCAGVLALSGCAKGPEGGPTTPQAPNRLAVSMRLQQAINPAYFYSFAFDDDDDPSDGPNAIITSTTITNGIVGGAFGVLVEVRGGQFNVFRRTFVNGQETLVRAPNPFVSPPSPPTGATIAFTLNLDATLADGSRLFRSANNDLPRRLDVNFVTSNERRRDPNDLRRKAFDAFGPATAGRYSTLAIDSSRSYTNQTSGVNEVSGDVTSDDTSNAVNRGQLDIADFRIDVQRG
jgi:hypothetical protein